MRIISRFVVPVLCGALVLGMTGCSGSSDTKTDTQAASSEVAATEAATKAAEEQPYKVEISGVERTTDYEGKPAALIHMTFTNNSKETTSLASAAIIYVFQDGVEQEMAITDADTSGYTNNVQPGATINVDLAYEAPSESDIQVQVKELFGDAVYADQTFSLA